MIDRAGCPCNDETQGVTKVQPWEAGEGQSQHLRKNNFGRREA